MSRCDYRSTRCIRDTGHAGLHWFEGAENGLAQALISARGEIEMAIEAIAVAERDRAALIAFVEGSRRGHTRECIGRRIFAVDAFARVPDCTCGADEYNARLDALLADVRK